jgi:hypothetical protein
VDEIELKNALEEIFDQAILFHAFTDYMRDYELIAYVSTDPQSGIQPRTLRYLFKYCVEAHVESSVTPDSWRRSLDDVLIDAKGGPEHEGYVWGIRWQNLYPGAKVITDSLAASSWEKEVGIDFHEVVFETNGHKLQLVFSDLEVTEVQPGYRPFEVPEDYEVVIDFRPVDEADRAFGYWLKHRGLTRDQLEDDDYYADTGRGEGGSTIRQYRVRTSIASKERIAPFGAPAPPTLDLVEEQLRALIMKRVSRRDAAAWAMQWVGADEPGVTDNRVWNALTALGAADMPTTDREWLYEREDFEAWLRELLSPPDGL